MTARQYKAIVTKAIRKKTKAIKSEWEELLAIHLKEKGLVAEREYRFCDRLWRFDFAFPDIKLGIEIQGGIWMKGRHSRGRGMISDCDKRNAATLLGWKVLYFTPEHVKSGEAISTILKGVGRW